MNLNWMNVETRLGRFTVIGRDFKLVHVGLPGNSEMEVLAQVRRSFPDADLISGTDATLLETATQLQEYAEGLRTEFHLPLDPPGTEFQKTVWNALTNIPYGETRSYGDLAQEIGKPGASRAVGQANGRNPIPIIVPCHRVLAADGSIGGYMGDWGDGGGILFKQRLLELEKKGKMVLESVS